MKTKDKLMWIGIGFVVAAALILSWQIGTHNGHYDYVRQICLR